MGENCKDDPLVTLTVHHIPRSKANLVVDYATKLTGAVSVSMAMVQDWEKGTNER